jgi:hypothetical protein
MSAVPFMASHISISAWSLRRSWVEQMGQNENHHLHEKKTVLNNLTEI